MNHRIAVRDRRVTRPLRLSLLALGLAWSAAGAVAQTLSAPTLSAPGSVAYDAEGIPLIRAGTDNDAAFLQGWAHARDRFFQMDTTRRGASGTLAELVGASVLADDVQTRTIGLRRAALATWQATSADTRGWLKAYSDGVNYWLRNNALPPEYAPLEISRVPAWDPVDTLVIGKALAFQLSFDLDIEQTLRFGAYQQAAAVGGFDATALFFGDTDRIAPSDDRVSVPGFQPGGSALTGAEIGNGASLVAADDPIAQILGHGASEIDAIDPQTLELARALRDKLARVPLFERALAGKDSPIGSNEWAVSGEHTASGKALVANDPHLGLDLPSIFVEHHVFSSDARHGATPLDAVGVSLPGVPGIIQGCNQRICWGTTTNSLDVTDVYQETFRVNTLGLPYATVHGSVEEPVRWVFQSFFVNAIGDGQNDTVARDNSIGYLNGAITVVVPRRNNGPVLQISGASGLSVAYAGWGPTNELESFRRINSAQNVEQFEDALSYFDVGSQNFVYGDVDGNIAYYTTGEAPIRTDLQTLGGPDGGVPPWFIRNAQRQHDWLPVANRQPNQSLPYEIMPFAEMPQVVNPARGYLANANNDPSGYSLDNNALNQARPGGGIHYIDNGGASSYRMGRIDRALQAMIASGVPITADDMKQLQSNNQSMDAELVLPHLLLAWDRAADSDWAPLRALAEDARVSEAIGRLRDWDYSTPTGIQAGYDAGDNPASLPAPSAAQVDASVAATIWAQWRSHAVRATIDATLQRVGLGGALPGNADAYTGFKFLLDVHYFLAYQGRGASGLVFFVAEGAPYPEDARDHVLLKALKDALDALAGDDFAPAFAGSQTLADYRWGKLHRITFRHPLGGPFNLPGANPYGFADLAPDLPGLARPGGFEVVDASGHGIRAQGLNGFTFGSGPARRFVGEMSTPIKAFEIIPGGQSGVLGSPLYASQLGRWLTNDYHDLKISASAAAAASPTVVNFAP